MNQATPTVNPYESVDALYTVKLNTRFVVETKILGYMPNITLTSIKNINTLEARNAAVSR